jgi:hypothetical protein
MPVIGRLDRQVNDLLIEPIGRRRPEEELPPAENARPPAAPRLDGDGSSLAVNQARPDGDNRPDRSAGPQPTPEHESSQKHSSETESRARTDELPVWLL